MKKCFTLIELLVVIAIIGILSAILFPTLGSALERGKQTSCASNLREIGKGLVSYAARNDAALPTIPTGKIGPDDKEEIIDSIDGEYCVLNALRWTTLENPKLFICPSVAGVKAAKSDEFLKYGDVTKSKDKDRNITYAFCAGLISGESKIDGMPDSSVAADFTGYGDNYADSSSARQPNHKDYGAILKLDGHVEGFEGKKCGWFSSEHTGYYDGTDAPKSNIFLYPNENRKTNGSIGFEENEKE